MDGGSNIETIEPKISKITKEDLKPKIPQADGTTIILQRHEKQIREKDNPKAGSLYKEASEIAKASGKDLTKIMLEQLTEEERDSVDIMVIASDTQYYQGGKRSIETADKIMEGIKESFDELGIDQSHLLNESGRFLSTGPIPIPNLREPKIFTDSPEFVKFMEGKYGTGQDFWKEYEADTEKEERLKMGAEGPFDMADRIATFLSLLSRHAKAYHNANPGRRLVIWAVSHHDTISPYVKKYIADMPESENLYVDYGSGIAIDIQKSGEATTTIGNNNYNVPLGRPKPS